MLPVQNNYLNTQVQTSTPSELTLLLYNGCVKFIKMGIAAIEQKDIMAKHTNLIKAQDIIDELQATLNMEYEISHNLSALYTFIHSQLLQANMKMDREAAEISLSLVVELRDTWSEAMKSLKSNDKVRSTV